MTSVVAVDWGATSIRVARVDLDQRPPLVEVVHRHAHAAGRHADGSLRWDWDRLVAETERGIDIAIAAGPVASIGIDTWAVDYGLLDDAGRLLSPPHAYRSERTAGWRGLVDRIGAGRLYQRTGIQLQPFNTIFQLAVHDPTELDRAAHVVLLGDLLVHRLTGAIASERTAAGSTGLLDLATRQWSEELLDVIGVPPARLPAVVEPATEAGRYRGVPVHRVCAHDTASAVVAMGPAGGPSVGFVATGTWLLVGREQPGPDTSPSAQAANFTNEQGAEATIRFLKNVAGFWMLDQCKAGWGLEDPVELLDAAATVEGAYDVFDATDPSLLAPDDMDATVRRLAGLGPEAPPALVTRAIVESMAATAADVLGGLGAVAQVALVGGGVGVPLLAERLAARSGLPVAAGSTEAAALGNGLVQGVALGRFADVADARRHLVP